MKKHIRQIIQTTQRSPVRRCHWNRLCRKCRQSHCSVGTGGCLWPCISQTLQQHL